MHAVIGGQGPPLLLIHGWPQTWYAWRMVTPALARDFQVVAVDQRGIGLTDKPKDGYDTGSLARDLVALMEALGHRRFAMYGTDVGMPIAYALAADHPERVERLVVSEAVIAGVTPSLPLIVPTQQANHQLWHIPFNRVAEVNEQLVKGREAIYFSSRLHGLPDDVVRYYVRILKSDRHALRGSFGQYRAFDATIVQNQQRMTQRLTLPVLAIGGAQGLGELVGKTMALVADDLQTPGHPRYRPLVRRAGARGTGGGADQVPGPLAGTKRPRTTLGRVLPRRWDRDTSRTAGTARTTCAPSPQPDARTAGSWCWRALTPEYFVAHTDLTKVAEYTAEAAKAGGPQDASLGMLSHKLSALPVVTIAKLRGRARGG
jgi:pimeloyl-ACP methyl ester carboxylesterase